MDDNDLYWFWSLQWFRPSCSKMLKTKHTPKPGVDSHNKDSTIFNFYLTCQCGCQRCNVWAPVFYSCNSICILPKFLRRHKGRMIPNVTATTRIRPSTYHALYKTFKKYHEHTPEPFWHSSNSADLFDRCSYRSTFSILTLRQGRWGPCLNFAEEYQNLLASSS